MTDQTKKALYNYCLDYVNQRIKNAKTAVESAQASANAETKSTAGDKHDTARAMMQLEAENNAKQLDAANKLMRTLTSINPDQKCARVESGSLIITSAGNFYVAISAGKIEHEGTTYFAAAPSSPLIQALHGLKAGENTVFNGRKFEILTIY